MANGIASTPASRRALWTEDARRLVDDLRRSDPTGGMPPWRVAYIAGFELLTTTPAAFTLKGARRSPHKATDIVVPREGAVPATAIDAICWTFDQTAARFVEYANDDVPDPLPAGPLLVDHVTAAALARHDVDEWRLRGAIDVEETIVSRWLDATVRSAAGRLALSVSFDMNAVHASFDAPGGGTWRSGRLTIRLPTLPETIKVAARGRPLASVIDHPLAAAAPQVLVTGLTQDDDGTARIDTDAMRPDAMTTLPQSPRRIAA